MKYRSDEQEEYITLAWLQRVGYGGNRHQCSYGMGLPAKERTFVFQTNQ